jgi:hypothetical protein
VDGSVEVDQVDLLHAAEELLRIIEEPLREHGIAAEGGAERRATPDRLGFNEELPS